MAQRYEQFPNLASFSLIIYRHDVICVMFLEPIIYTI